MPTHLLGNKPEQRKISAPVRREEWKVLMQKAIQRAEKTQDRRLQGLRHALASNSTEAYLKKLGVIHEADIEREFPIKK